MDSRDEAMDGIDASEYVTVGSDEPTVITYSEGEWWWAVQGERGRKAKTIPEAVRRVRRANGYITAPTDLEEMADGVEVCPECPKYTGHCPACHRDRPAPSGAQQGNGERESSRGWLVQSVWKGKPLPDVTALRMNERTAQLIDWYQRQTGDLTYIITPIYAAPPAPAQHVDVRGQVERALDRLTVAWDRGYGVRRSPYILTDEEYAAIDHLFELWDDHASALRSTPAQGEEG